MHFASALRLVDRKLFLIRKRFTIGYQTLDKQDKLWKLWRRRYNTKLLPLHLKWFSRSWTPTERLHQCITIQGRHLSDDLFKTHWCKTAFCVLSRNRKTFAISSLVLNLFASQIGELFLPYSVYIRTRIHVRACTHTYTQSLSLSHTHTHTQTHSQTSIKYSRVSFYNGLFYDPCQVGTRSTLNMWCITVGTQASFLYLVCF